MKALLNEADHVLHCLHLIYVLKIEFMTESSSQLGVRAQIRLVPIRYIYKRKVDILYSLSSQL